jgi:hypothetical protein
MNEALGTSYKKAMVLPADSHDPTTSMAPYIEAADESTYHLVYKWSANGPTASEWLTTFSFFAYNGDIDHLFD